MYMTRSPGVRLARVPRESTRVQSHGRSILERAVATDDALNDKTFRRIFLASAVVIMASLTLVQLFYPSYLPLSPAFALIPFAASLFMPWRPVLFLAVIATSFAFLTGARTGLGMLIDTDDMIRTITVAVGSGMSVLSSFTRENRERALIQVSEIAKVSQSTIIRPLPSQVHGMYLATRYESATQDSLVGGDLFDAIETATGVTLLIGDVKGKGLDAVRVAAATVWGFRSSASRTDGDDLEMVGSEIYRLVSPELGPEDFVTLVVLHITDTGEARLLNFGHPPPLVLDARGVIREMQVSDPHPPLGVTQSTPMPERFALARGERVVLYTDGVMESRNARGVFLDLAAAVSATHGQNANRAVESIVHAAKQHAGGDLNDDVAVVTLDIPIN